MKGLGDLMKQAQAMQEQMQGLQEEMAQAEVQGEAGAGMLQVTMNGRHAVRRVHIDPTVMGEDKQVLEDLIAAAINDAIRKVEALQKDKMSSLAGGLGMPMGGFPFG